MLLTYYHVSFEDDGIEDILRENDGGTDMAQIGRVFLRLGFSASLITRHPKLFSFGQTNLSHEEIQAKVRHGIDFPTGRTHDRITLTNLYRFMQEGGTVRALTPTFDIIQEEIDAGRPLIAYFATSFDGVGQSGMDFHPIVITGYDDKHVFINDGTIATGGHKKILAEWFFSGIYKDQYENIDCGSLLLLSQKE